jgi:hypothetical protein
LSVYFKVFIFIFIFIFIFDRPCENYCRTAIVFWRFISLVQYMLRRWKYHHSIQRNNISWFLMIVLVKDKHYSDVRIKICLDLHKLHLWFFRVRQCLFLKLLRQWTHKMGRFLSTLKHSHPIFIWYTNSRLRLEFVYQIKIGCSCFNYSI